MSLRLGAVILANVLFTYQVSPAYDTNAELTTMVAADLIQEFIQLALKEGERVPAIKGMKINVQGAAKSANVSAHDEL